jgi:hypothetical protein
MDPLEEQGQLEELEPLGEMDPLEEQGQQEELEQLGGVDPLEEQGQQEELEQQGEMGEQGQPDKMVRQVQLSLHTC